MGSTKRPPRFPEHDRCVAPIDLAAMLRRVRLVAFDFDGVFTDNTVWVDDAGVESVRCWRGDGIGLAELRRIGVHTLVISTETNPVVGARCRKLGVPCHQACADKLGTLRRVATELGCSLEETAFVGNDVNDRECLEGAGLAIVVVDAHPEVRPLAAYTTQARGGRGAVREVCDLVRNAVENHRHDS